MKPAICALPGNERMATRLAEALGFDTVKLSARYFPDGESYLRFEDDPAGRELALVCTLNEPDAKVLPLLFAANTAHELGAARVGLITPYLAYMRQDRRFQSGEAVTSTLFAAVLSQAFDWLVTIDPHLHRHHSLSAIYSVPAVAVAAAPALSAWIRANVENPLLVGPDSESEQWVREVAATIGAPHVVLQKTRLGDRDVKIEAPPLDRFRDHTAVLLDDIVSSAHTMAAAARLLTDGGLTHKIGLGVHGLFAGDALTLLRASGVERVVTTNTVEHETNAIDISALLADAIHSLLLTQPTQ